MKTKVILPKSNCLCLVYVLISDCCRSCHLHGYLCTICATLTSAKKLTQIIFNVLLMKKKTIVVVKKYSREPIKAPQKLRSAVKMKRLLLLSSTALVAVLATNNYTDTPQLDFDYSADGVRGQAQWKAHFPQCGGNAQSPIDIKIDDTIPKKYHNPLRSTNINIKPIEIEIIRTKYSAIFNFYWACCAPNIYGGPLKGIYRFHNMHCHWGKENSEGSEHTINGKRFALECHLVFYNTRYETWKVAANHTNGLAVFAILYSVGKYELYFPSASVTFFYSYLKLNW